MQISLLLLFCELHTIGIFILFITSLPQIKGMSSSASRALPQLRIGFLGCGKISSAVCRGFAGAPPALRPAHITVSQRSAAKSSALAAEFPDLITVANSNAEVVAAADVVFVGLLPDVAREVLPQMPFTTDHLVISMMAAVDYEETVRLTKLPTERVVKTVPLPAAARRSGPVLSYPPNPEAEAVLSVVSTPVVCTKETDMKPMICLTGHISSFFELMNTSQQFMVANGMLPTALRHLSQQVQTATSSVIIHLRC